MYVGPVKFVVLGGNWRAQRRRQPGYRSQWANRLRTTSRDNHSHRRLEIKRVHGLRRRLEAFLKALLVLTRNSILKSFRFHSPSVWPPDTPETIPAPPLNRFFFLLFFVGYSHFVALAPSAGANMERACGGGVRRCLTVGASYQSQCLMTCCVFCINLVGFSLVSTSFCGSSIIQQVIGG